MYDIIYLYDIKKENRQLNSLRERFPLIKIIKYDNDNYDALTRARKSSITKFFWVINLEDDHVINDDFNFDYVIPEWDKNYVHVWKTSKDEFKSVYLMAKDYLFTKREADYLFFINKKEILIEASRYGYDVLRLEFNDNVYKRIVEFQKKTRTSMFWVLAPECKLLTELTYIVPDYDKEYVHQWTPINNEAPNVFLISPTYPISIREAEYLFFVSKKIMEDKISKVGYDTLQLEFSDNAYDRITSFQKTVTTSMFWVLAPECKLLTELTYIVPDYDKEYVHQWTALNSEYLHLNLIPKKYTISKREATNLFFVSKKEIVESLFKETYDIIFISYNEPNADENYQRLLKRFPNTQRVHGVTGIHNAHIQAAKISKTSMFWVVDGDSQIVDEFDFDYVVNPWDRDAVSVWKSINPINNLSYGNGGVKLLPKDLTMELDTSTIDMTTSISKKFNSIDQISNLTIFNTDPFNTWKSAFRECVKLSSKIIDGQVDIETETRLNVWCTVGFEQTYGEYAIKGANSGRNFGIKYRNNLEEISKINDWEWLTGEFNKL